MWGIRKKTKRGRPPTLKRILRLEHIHEESIKKLADLEKLCTEGDMNMDEAGMRICRLEDFVQSLEEKYVKGMKKAEELEKIIKEMKDRDVFDVREIEVKEVKDYSCYDLITKRRNSKIRVQFFPYGLKATDIHENYTSLMQNKEELSAIFIELVGANIEHRANLSFNVNGEDLKHTSWITKRIDNSFVHLLTYDTLNFKKGTNIVKFYDSL